MRGGEGEVLTGPLTRGVVSGPESWGLGRCVRLVVWRKRVSCTKPKATNTMMLTGISTRSSGLRGLDVLFFVGKGDAGLGSASLSSISAGSMARMLSTGLGVESPRGSGRMGLGSAAARGEVCAATAGALGKGAMAPGDGNCGAGGRSKWGAVICAEQEGHGPVTPASALGTLRKTWQWGQ